MQDSIQTGQRDIAESRDDFSLGFADLTCLSLGDLAELDEAVIERTVERLLPKCTGVGHRLWNQGGEQARAARGTGA